MYGVEACDHGIGTGNEDRNGWACDPAKWQGGVRVGDYYRVRDTDMLTLSDSEDVPLDDDGDGMGDPWERAWGLVSSLGDPDNDEATNLVEFQWDTFPVDARGVGPRAVDHDQDRWWDGPEIRYWDATPGTPLISAAGLALKDPDASLDLDEDGVFGQHDKDADGDDLGDGDEIENGTFPELPDSDCGAGYGACQDVNATRFGEEARSGSPGSGDNMTDLRELSAWDRLDPSARGVDHDADGIVNALLDPDADGDGVIDGDEFTCRTPRNVPGRGPMACTSPAWWDSDEDGLLDALDVTLPATHPTSLAFEQTGIVYVGSPTGERRYLGEVSQGTDPLDRDTDDDSIPDGAEASGVHPAVREAQREVGRRDPSNEDHEDLPPQAEWWLESGERDREEPSEGQLDTSWLLPPPPTTEDILNTTTETIEPLVFEPFEEFPVVLDAADCAQTLASATTPGIAQAVECATGAVLAKVPPVLPLIATTTPTVTGLAVAPPPEDAVVARVTRNVSAVVERAVDHVDDPLGSLQLGPMPVPDLNSSVPSLPGLTINDLRWGSTPYPQLLADATSELLNGLVYDTIRDADERLEAELIGTLDASAYNVLLQTPDGRVQIRTNTPVGSPVYLDLDDPDNLGQSGAELRVTAALTPTTSGSAKPVVTIERLSPEVDLLVAAFMQLPGTDLVLALGEDGRTTGLHERLVLEASASTLNLAPGTSAELTATTAEWRSLVIQAALIRVDELASPKVPVPGHRREIALTIDQARGKTTIQLARPSPDQTSLSWSSAAVADVQLAARSVAGDEEWAIYTIVRKMPQTLRTTITTDDVRVRMEHAASGPVEDLRAIFEHATGESYSFGSLQASALPPIVIAEHDSATKTLTYTADRAVGRLRALLGSGPSPSSVRCRVSTTAEHLIHTRDGPSSCTSIDITGLRSLSATYDSANWSLNAERAWDADRFVLSLSVPERDLFATVAPWPDRISLQTTVRPDAIQARHEASRGIDEVAFGYQDPTTRMAGRALDVPEGITVTATHATGTLDVRASLTTRLKDVAFVYSKNGAQAGLGDADGAIYSTSGTNVPDAIALRLRDFSGASLRANATTGATLLVDTRSAAPFLVRWRTQDGYFEADLPRLAASATIQITQSAGSFGLEYSAAEGIDRLAGEIRLDSGGTRAALNVTDLPTSLSVLVASDRSIDVVSSTPIGQIQLALFGDEGRPTAPGRELFVRIDETRPVAILDLSLPRIAVDVKGLREAHLRTSSLGIEVATILTTSPQGALIEYAGADGDLIEVDVSSQLPPEFRLNATSGSITWAATPTTRVDATAKLRLDAFEGRVAVEGLPANARIDLARTADRVNATLRHAESTWPRLEVEGTFADPTTGERRSLWLRGVDLPPSIVVEANATASTAAFRAATSQGTPAKVGELDLAYAADAEAGLVILRDSPAVGLLLDAPDGAPPRFHARLAGVETLVLANGTNGEAVRSLELKGSGGALAVVVDADLRLTALATALPASAQIELGYDASGALDSIRARGSDVTKGVTLVLEADGREAYYQGDVPSSLDAELSATGISLVASPPLTATIGTGPVGASFLPSGTGDGVFARSEGRDRLFGARVSNVAALEYDPVSGTVRAQRASTKSLSLDVVTSEYATLRGVLNGLPGVLDLSLSNEGLEWTASGQTTSADLLLAKPARYVRVFAERIPSRFTFTRTSAEATLTVADGSSFGKLDLGYSEYVFEHPDLRSQGFALVEGATSDGIPTIALRARVDDLRRASIRTGDAFSVNVERTARGGPFDANVRVRGHSAAFRSLDLPQRFDLVIDASTSPAVMLNASSDLGYVTLDYSGLAAPQASIRAWGLPSHVDLDGSLDAQGQLRGSVHFSPTPSAPVGVNATVATGDVLIEGDLLIGGSDVSFHVSTDGNGGVVAPGGVSGWLVLGTEGSRVNPIPPQEVGISVNTKGALALFARAEGVTEASYQQESAATQLVVKHLSSPPKPFVARYSGDEADAHAALLGVPRSMRLEMSRSAEEARFRYDGSEVGGSIVARYNATDEDRSRVLASLSPIPKEISATITLGDAGDVYASVERSPETVPTLTINASDDRRRIINATLRGLAARSTLAFDVDAPCSVSLDASDPMEHVLLEIAERTGGRSPWAMASTDHVSIVTEPGRLPSVHAAIRGLQSLTFCGGDGLTVDATVGAVPELRVHYEEPDTLTSLKMRAQGLAAGQYKFRAVGGLNYEAPGRIDLLDVQLRAFIPGAIMGRPLTELRLYATGVGSNLTMADDGGRVRMTAKEQRFEFVRLTGKTGPAGDKAARPVVGSSPTGLIADKLSFGTLSARFSESGNVSLPSAAHRFAFVDKEERFELGIEFAEFKFVDLRVEEDRFALEGLDVDPGRSFAARVDGGSLGDIVLRVSDMPTRLAFFLEGESVAGKAFTATIAPSGPIQEIRIQKAGWEMLGFSLYDVPAGPTRISVEVGKTVALFLAAPTLIARVGIFLRTAVGVVSSDAWGVQTLNVWGDLDGASDTSGNRGYWLVDGSAYKLRVEASSDKLAGGITADRFATSGPYLVSLDANGAEADPIPHWGRAGSATTVRPNAWLIRDGTRHNTPGSLWT